MEIPYILIDTISMELPIVYFKGSPINFSKLRCISVPVFILANSADTDEMQHMLHFIDESLLFAKVNV